MVEFQFIFNSLFRVLLELFKIYRGDFSMDWVTLDFRIFCRKLSFILDISLQF